MSETCPCWIFGPQTRPINEVGFRVMLPSDPGKQLISLDLELQRARSNRTQGVQSGPKWMYSSLKLGPSRSKNHGGPAKLKENQGWLCTTCMFYRVFIAFQGILTAFVANAKSFLAGLFLRTALFCAGRVRPVKWRGG